MVPIILRAMARGISCLALTGCSWSDLPSDAPEDGGYVVGWGHGECMAIDVSNVAPGDEITVVGMMGPHRLARATVGRATASSENCYPLLEDREDVNTSSDHTFHLINGLPGASAFGLFIVLAGRRPDMVVDQGIAYADVDGDGHRDKFGQCSTSEGILFSIASGPSGTERNIWEGYYYLGYDSEVTCP